jgi:hypothetical protein
MSNLPRRRIEPLAPPPDSFDRVLATARSRRRHRGLIAASSTMVLVLVAAASFALGASLHASHRLDPASKATSKASPTTTDPIPPTPTPKHTRKNGDAVAGVGTSGVGGQSPSVLRGRAVDPDGHGIPGLYVMSGSHGTFVPYSGVTAGGQWAATYVGSKSGAPVVPRCDRSYKTTLFPGATLTGKVLDSGDCVQGDNYHVWLYFRYHQTTAIRLHGLYSGDTFTVSGLPAGTYELGLRMQMRKVPVAAGSTTEADIYFTCDGTTEYPKDREPRPQVTPTPEPSPEPPPSPTPTPSIE